MGIIFCIPLVLGIIELMWREVIGHGMCNTLLLDYPIIIGCLTIFGILLLIGAMK